MQYHIFKLHLVYTLLTLNSKLRLSQLNSISDCLCLEPGVEAGGDVMFNLQATYHHLASI